MNVTAFLVALIVTLGYYMYNVRKERARVRCELHNSEEAPNSEGGNNL